MKCDDSSSSPILTLATAAAAIPLAIVTASSSRTSTRSGYLASLMTLGFPLIALGSRSSCSSYLARGQQGHRVPRQS
ncbi:hypothetical protein NL676_011272 [Syzygium grande]|nr:hypothetical protein NL676_011272 [Syzygium grande]